MEERSAALRESEDRLSGIIESATDAIIAVDSGQRITLFNAAENMFRCTAVEALGQSVERFIPQRFRVEYGEHMWRFVETGVPKPTMGPEGTLWGLRSDGEEFPLEASISQPSSGGQKLFMAIVRDITERRQIDEIRERLAAVVESSADAIISKTLDGIITGWNRGAQNIFGYTASEAVGKPMLMLMPAERLHEEADILARIRRGENIEHFETVRLRNDGTKIDVSATISAIRDSSGTIVGASTFARDITESKHTENALQQSDARRRFALETAKLGDWEIDLTTMRAVRSFRHDEIFGYQSPLPEWSFDIFLRHVHPDDQERVRENFQVCITQGKRWEFECRIVHLNGDIRWIWVCGECYRELSGDSTRMFGIIEDITERKSIADAQAKQAEELARSRQELEEQARMLDLAPVLVRDMRNRVVLWPRGAEKLYGISSQEAIGAVSHSLLHTQFPEPMEMVEKKLFATGGWEGELIHRKGDGSVIVVASIWVLYRNAQGEAIRILEVNTDVTARKEAEERLSSQAEELSRQAEELIRSRQAMESQARMLKLVLDSMGEGLVATDKEGHFLIWNDAADKILGRQAEDLPPEEWTPYYQIYLPDAITPYPPDQLPLAMALRGESAQSELVVQHPDHEERVFLEVTTRPLKDDQGNLCGGVAAFRDITKRKAAEREIQMLNHELEARVVERTAELEATNKDLEAFTYSVSHDLRAPLRHISGFTRILVEDFSASLPEEAQRHLQRIEQGAQRMGVLVDELLNLTRVGRQALVVQVTGLDAIVKDVLTLFEEEMQGRKIEWKIGDLPFVECDPNLVRQVFQNLIGNALKYSRPRALALIEIGQIEKDGQRVIFVRDNGVGFSMKYADKLFGVFQRLHRPEDFEGTGVGLATVQRIVKKHGGQVWAEAELDRGATFYFTLSGAEPAAKEASARAGGQS